jgi:opacity protein-like surface antigen
VSLYWKLKKSAGATAILFLLFAPRAASQAPIAAGMSSEYKASVGYSYTNVPIPSQSSLKMNGIDGGLTVGIKPWIGVELDLGFTFIPDALSTQRSAKLFTYMGGPVVYLHRGRRLLIYAHGLVGAAYESGVNYSTDGDLLHGYVNKLAWAAGGGAEYRLDRSLSLRFGADYLNTTFFTPAISMAGQHDLRAIAGISYRFGGRER